MVDLQVHDIEVHVIFPWRRGGGFSSAGLYRARFKDEPEVEGFGCSQRTALDDLYEARKLRQEKAPRPAEDPLSGFMRHAAALIDGVTKMGWQASGSPAVSPGADGGGEVTLTLRLGSPPRTVVVFAVDEWP